MGREWIRIELKLELKLELELEIEIELKVGSFLELFVVEFDWRIWNLESVMGRRCLA